MFTFLFQIKIGKKVKSCWSQSIQIRPNQKEPFFPFKPRDGYFVGSGYQLIGEPDLYCHVLDVGSIKRRSAFKLPQILPLAQSSSPGSLQRLLPACPPAGTYRVGPSCEPKCRCTIRTSSHVKAGCSALYRSKKALGEWAQGLPGLIMSLS